MPKLPRLRPKRLLLVLALALGATAGAVVPAVPPPVGTPAPQPPVEGAQPGTISWEDLVPAVSRGAYRAGPPPAVHDYLSGESGLAAQQPQDYSVNAALDGRSIRLPGFIVPLEMDAQGRVTEFFLVPYYGACIHVPPPAPNQMLYVTYPKGLQLESMYAAYWISGRISTHTRQSKLGSAAYALAASGIEPYRY